MKRIAILASCMLLAGCQVGPHYHAPHLHPPQQFENAVAGAPLGTWWHGFNDPVLDKLVAATIAGNLDVQMVRQRIIEARSERDVAGAALYPQINAVANPFLANSPTYLQWPPGVGEYRSYAIGFDSSWELDIFGGIHRAEQAGQDDLQAQIEARHGALISAIADMAADYFALRAIQTRITIAQHSLDTANHLLALTQTEFDRGLTTSLAVAQAQAQMDTVAASLPVLHAQEGRIAHAIGVLTGAWPATLEPLLAAPATPSLPAPPPLPASIPSDVIANRPDIRAAERILAGDTERIGAAVAQLYPHFAIPLELEPTSSYLSKLFTVQSLLWEAGLSVTQSVYTGGRLHARVVEAKAAAEYDRLAYQKTVLQAFQDVEDALLTYQTETQQLHSLVRATEDNRLALDRAERLFRAGLTDFINPLNAERSYYASQDAMVQSQLAQLQQLIALDKALGGDWQAVPFADDAILAK